MIAAVEAAKKKLFFFFFFFFFARRIGLVTTAEVRPARAPRTPEGVTRFRQVSWLADPHACRLAGYRKAQWYFGEGLTADSCGGSSGLALKPFGAESLFADQHDDLILISQRLPRASTCPNSILLRGGSCATSSPPPRDLF